MAAGKFVIPTIFTAYDKVSSVVNTIRTKISSFAGAGAANFQRMFTKVGNLADGAFNKIVNIRNAIGIAFAGGALVSLFNMTAATAAYADELATTSKRLGITTQSFQELSYAAKLQNVDQETLTKSLEKLNKNVGDAQKGQGALYASMKKSNPALLKQLKNTKDTGVAFDIAIAAIDKQPTAMKKASMATAIFGKSGQSMLNLIADGTGGLAKLREEARKYGAILSDDAIAAASKFDDAHDRMNYSITAVKNVLGAELFPILTTYMNKMVEWVANNKELLKAKTSEWVKRIGTALEWAAKNFETIVIWTKRFIILLIFLKTVSIVMATLNAAIAIYSALTKTVTALQWLWNAAMLANPMVLIITAIILAIGALIAVIALVIIHTKGWGAQWQNVMAWMSSRFNVFKLGLELGWLLIKNSFLNLTDAIVMAWKWAMNKIGALSDAQYKSDISAIQKQQAERVKAIKSTANELNKAAVEASQNQLQWKLGWDNGKDPVNPATNPKQTQADQMQQAMESAVNINIDNKNNSKVDVKHAGGGTAPKVRTSKALAGFGR